MKRCIPLLFLLAACHAGTVPVPLRLEPAPPLVAVQVADPQEAGLLVQAIGAQPELARADSLYFAAAMADRLRGAGFDPQPVDAEQARHRVVRAYGTGDAGLRAGGMRILTREQGYWVVDGSLAQLRRLQAGGGYVLARIGASEPRPREVRVTVPAQADVQRVYDLGVDIFGAAPEGGRVVVGGGAYEWQIEAMTAAGYTVERTSSVPSPSE
ncbi:MAG TPA: hypothetical protein VLK84_13910 [Longimicrobium sp.]|nr:hypothetical protein [Longimicrobium sp.]